MQFENGKSLYEILTQLGRTFYGTPRLLKGDIITFDIFKDTVNGNPDFIDSTELMNTKSNIDNHATGFVSNVYNVTSDNNYIVYPGGDI